jgi:hypothetical protein
LLAIDIGHTPSVAANAQQIVPGPDGVVTLPAGVELSDVHVVGRNLVIDMPDGSQMVIVDGAVFVPQLVLNGVEVPSSNLAALLIDLKSRDLLKDTLVLWGGEFGRTPTAEGTNGREHHPFGFSMWMAGGGVKGGMVHGATDDFGWHAVKDKVHVHDLHATILHLMGLNHEKLTYHFAGRDYRLTDVYGNVVKAILA